MHIDLLGLKFYQVKAHPETKFHPWSQLATWANTKLFIYPAEIHWLPKKCIYLCSMELYLYYFRMFLFHWPSVRSQLKKNSTNLWNQQFSVRHLENPDLALRFVFALSKFNLKLNLRRFMQQLWSSSSRNFKYFL